MNKTLLVAKREYLKVVRKYTFWIATLAFPILITILMAISSFSQQASMDILKKQGEGANKILIMDEANVINKEFIQAPFQEITNLNDGISLVKKQDAEALFYYPSDLITSKKIGIYTQDKGIFSNFRYNEIATNLLKQGILKDIKDENKIQIFNSNYNISLEVYKNGLISNTGIEKLIIPGIGVVLYFILISFASSYLLLSVSEEKENRVIETVLTIIKPKNLIWGKIIGQVAVVITQMLFLIGMILIAFLIIKPNLPIDLSKITITPDQIIASIFYTFTGFLILACTMVGVGAAMPTYKEASSFSSVFILLSILPIYLVGLIIADPNGLLSIITSYFPLTSAMVLLFRNALGELSLIELIFSGVVMILYVVFFFYLAYKIFELGSLEYNRKLSLQQIYYLFKKR
ncbi:MAG: ABC transporter permease [bacterium]